METRSHGKGRKLGIWVFPEYAGYIGQVQRISSVIEHAIPREIHYDACNERVGGLYQLSIILGSVRRGIDLGQVALIRRRSKYVVTIAATQDAIGNEYFDGPAALKFSPTAAVDNIVQDLDLRVPVSEYIDTDYECSGYTVSSPEFKRKILQFLDDDDDLIAARLAVSSCSGLDGQVERFTSDVMTVEHNNYGSVLSLSSRRSQPRYPRPGLLASNSASKSFFKDFISRT